MDVAALHWGCASHALPSSPFNLILGSDIVWADDDDNHLALCATIRDLLWRDQALRPRAILAVQHGLRIADRQGSSLLVDETIEQLCAAACAHGLCVTPADSTAAGSVEGAAASPTIRSGDGMLLWPASSFDAAAVCVLELTISLASLVPPLVPHACYTLADDPSGDFSRNALWHVLVCRLLDGSRARRLIQLADEHGEAHGWSTRRHKAYPTIDIPVDESPALRREIRPFVNRLVLPTLASHYGFTTNELSVSDLFLAKYQGKYQGGAYSDPAETTPSAVDAKQDALAPHRDMSLLSFSILLSDESEFEGGGLRFASAGPECDACDGSQHARAVCARCGGTAHKPIPARRGDLTMHCGKLLHEALPVTVGLRYVVVGFVAVDSSRVDTEFVSGSVHANTSTIGGWGDYEIIDECMHDEDASAGVDVGDAISAVALTHAPRPVPASTTVHPSHDFGRYRAQSAFHHINLDYPGVQLVHEEPYIFTVADFASADECAQLIALYGGASSGDVARAKPSATAPGQEALRTSSTAFPSDTTLSWLRERISRLANVPLEALEPTKLTRYAAGQFFAKHTDASFIGEKLWAYSARAADVDDEDVQAPCGWPSRFVTLFLYLNDVADGGCTRFGWLDGTDSIPGSAIFTRALEERGSQTDGGGSSSTEVRLAPRTGLAVVHFPSSTSSGGGCCPDPRTMHESERAVDTKFIVQQFMWPCAIDPEGRETAEDVKGEWRATLREAGR